MHFWTHAVITVFLTGYATVTPAAPAPNDPADLPIKLQREALRCTRNPVQGSGEMTVELKDCSELPRETQR